MPPSSLPALAFLDSLQEEMAELAAADAAQALQYQDVDAMMAMLDAELADTKP
jgi:hypothetical protein